VNSIEGRRGGKGRSGGSMEGGSMAETKRTLAKLECLGRVGRCQITGGGHFDMVWGSRRGKVTDGVVVTTDASPTGGKFDVIEERETRKKVLCALERGVFSIGKKKRKGELRRSLG